MTVQALISVTEAVCYDAAWPLFPRSSQAILNKYEVLMALLFFFFKCINLNSEGVILSTFQRLCPNTNRIQKGIEIYFYDVVTGPGTAVVS